MIVVGSAGLVRSIVEQCAAERADRGLGTRRRLCLEGLPADAPQVGLGRSIPSNVDAGPGAGQAAFGTGQLEAGHDLLRRAVALEPGLGRAVRGRLSDLLGLGCELDQRALERVEAQPLDTSLGPDREGPGGYLRWSIGT